MQFVNLQRFDFGSLRDFSMPKDIANDILPEPVKPVEAAPPPPPPPPTYTVEQLENERQGAYENGYSKGLQDGIAKARRADTDRETALLATIKQCNEEIAGFKAQYEALIQQKAPEVMRLSYEIARTVIQQALSENQAMLVEALVKDCLPYLMREPMVTLTVNPETAPLVQEWFAKLAEQKQYDGMLRIVEDKKYEPTDGKLAWASGDAETRQELIWQRIRQRLHLNDIPPETTLAGTELPPQDAIPDQTTNIPPME